MAGRGNPLDPWDFSDFSDILILIFLILTPPGNQNYHSGPPWQIFWIWAKFNIHVHVILCNTMLHDLYNNKNIMCIQGRVTLYTSLAGVSQLVNYIHVWLTLIFSIIKGDLSSDHIDLSNANNIQFFVMICI